MNTPGLRHLYVNISLSSLNYLRMSRVVTVSKADFSVCNTGILTGMNGKVVRKETNPDPYSPIYDKVNQYLNGRDGRLHNGHTCLLFALIVKYDNHNIHLNNLSIFGQRAV